MTQALTETIVEDVSRGIILVMTVGAIIYLSATNQPVPQALSDIALLVVGFFFGAGVKNYARVKSDGGN